MTIHLHLIPRSQTFKAGDTVTLRFPLDTANPERDLTVSAEILPLLTRAETDYYVRTPDPAKLATLGQTLYRWLDGADRHLSRAIAGYRGTTRAVALLIEQEAELDHLPWELLHDGDGYLVQRSPTAVIPVRWRPGNLPTGDFFTTPQNRPLHVAFMATAPEAEADLDFEGEEAQIVEQTTRQPLQLSVEESGNLEELGYLLGGLGAGAVDVVHLTGHADHTDGGPIFLCEDEVGGVVWASAQAIADSLTHLPRLFFLSGCRTGQAQRTLNTGGTIPSLAAGLVDAGIPAVLGWGQPVYDSDAMIAAATLYNSLAQGLPLVRALADTYQAMLQRHAQDPDLCQHWHLLRLYARGPKADAPGSVADALVTPPRTRGRARLTTAGREPDHLDDEGRVPVAKRADFVGRRRAIQACLAALRADSADLGVILHGMGGNGKSTLAHRLRQRWLQRSEQHRAVVLYGKLDEPLLLRKLSNVFHSQAAREALQRGDTDALRFRLRDALELCDEQLLIILDNFEDNFEQEMGAPRLVDGVPLLTPETVALLDDLCFALQESIDRGQEHRLLLTSRYLPHWRGADRFYRRQLERLSRDAVQKKRNRLTRERRPATPEVEQLRERAVTIADGNPRLLEWLFALLDEWASAGSATGTSAGSATGIDVDALLARMAEQETALRENILADALLAAQTPTLRRMLARGLICELPVPAAVFDALDGLDPALPDTAAERERAAALGLLEATPVSGFQSSVSSFPSAVSELLRVPRILEPLLRDEEQPDAHELAATAARELYARWWEAEGANPDETQQLEIHRLALMGGEQAIAKEVGEALVGRWNRPDQYRYRETIELVEQTVAEVGDSYVLRHQLARALDFLGEKTVAISHYENALALCREEQDQNTEAAILNNIGLVYDALGEKQQALGYYAQALPLYRAVGDRGGEATTLNNIGAAYRALGEMEKALGYYEQALPLRRAVGDRGGEATTLNNIGLVYDALGEKQQALGYYAQALPLRRAVGDRGGEATTLNNIGGVYDALGEKQQALGYYAQALPLRRAVGDRGGEATTLNNIGGVYDALGEKQQALGYYAQALPLFSAVGDRGGEATTLNNIGAAYRALGEMEKALGYYEQALPLFSAVGDRWGESITRYNVAMVYVALGRLAEAVTELEQVVALDEATGHPDLASDRAMLEKIRAQLAGEAE